MATPFDMLDRGSRTQDNGAADLLASIIQTSAQAMPQHDGLFQSWRTPRGSPCKSLSGAQGEDRVVDQGKGIREG